MQADSATRIVIELDGGAAALDPEPIMAATLSLLGPFMESVNMVNVRCSFIEWHCGINHSA